MLMKRVDDVTFNCVGRSEIDVRFSLTWRAENKLVHGSLSADTIARRRNDTIESKLEFVVFLFLMRTRYVYFAHRRQGKAST